MATVSVTYFRPNLIRGGGAIIDTLDYVAEVITSSATSQSTTATSTLGRSDIRIVASGSNVYLAFGTAPVAVTGTGIMLVDGAEVVFSLPTGFKVAVVN